VIDSDWQGTHDSGGAHRDVTEDVISKYALGVTMTVYRALDREYDATTNQRRTDVAVCDRPGCGVVCKLLVCGQCGQRSYCGRACQIRDWREGHKLACKSKSKSESESESEKK
jgi:hypothetical protein